MWKLVVPALIASHLTAAAIQLGSGSVSVSGTRGPDTSTAPAYLTNPSAFAYVMTDGTNTVTGQDRRNTDPNGGANLDLEHMRSFDGTQVIVTGTVAALTVSDSEASSGGHSQAFAIGLVTANWRDQAAATYNENLLAAQPAPAKDGFAGIALGSVNGSLYLTAYDYDSHPSPVLVDLGAAGLASGATLQQEITFALTFSGGMMTVVVNGKTLGSIPISHDFSSANLVAMGFSADPANGTGSMVYSGLSVVPANGLPIVTAVVNGASFLPGIASGSWATITGMNLAASTATAASTDFVQNTFPTMLGGTSVTIDGLQAFIYYVSPTQLNVIVPDDQTIGQVDVTVTTSTGTSSAYQAIKSTLAPALFLFTARYPAANHEDGTPLGPPNIFSGATTIPAKPNETISLYGTGFGPTTPIVAAGNVAPNNAAIALPVTATVGGMPANVQGWLTFAGEYQFNVTVPNLPDGDAPLLLTILTVQTQAGLMLNIAH